MAKIKQSPKLPAEMRKQQLLTSACKLFCSKGYRNTTTEEIARKTSLTKGSLYFHFKSKEDILFSLVKSMSEGHDEVLSRIMKPKMKPSEILKSLNKVHDECEMGEFTDAIDIWVQAMKVQKIRKYMSDRIEYLAKLFADHVDPIYVKNKSALRQMAIMALSLHDGLSVFSKISPGIVDVRKQEKMFAEYFDVPAAIRQGRTK